MSDPVSVTQTPGGDWHTVEEIFHQALELPAESRAQFLRERCAGDEALQKEVREILDGYVAQERLSDSRDGTRFGAFEVIRKIGEGGMGVVYLGRREGISNNRRRSR